MYHQSQKCTAASYPLVAFHRIDENAFLSDLDSLRTTYDQLLGTAVLLCALSFHRNRAEREIPGRESHVDAPYHHL